MKLSVSLTEDDLIALDRFVEHAGLGSRSAGIQQAIRRLGDADLEDAYAAADLMVGRSGAGTVMETAAVGLPVVFVPLPHGNGEQARNAGFLIEADAGRLVTDAELTADRLVAEVDGLLADPQRLARMSATCRRLVPADSAAKLARLVLAAAQRRD